MNEIYDKINVVLQSDLTDYAIAKGIGDQSANYIGRLRKGESDIKNMPLQKAERFIEFYDELK